MFEHVPDTSAKRAELTPGVVAFRDRHAGRDWTFSEIEIAARLVAQGLTRMGMCDGDRLAILCLNRTEFFITLFACQKAGVILVPLNWRQTLSELLEAVEVVTPRALIFDRENQGLAGTLCQASGLTPVSIEEDLQDWLQEDAPVVVRSQVPGSRAWYLLFTSGTTGRPKAVIYTASMAWANAVNIGQAISLQAGDSCLNYLPLFHTSGINLYTLPAFMTGVTSNILPRFDADAVLALLAAGEVTQFFGVPAIYQAFSLHPAVDKVDWTTVRCGCGGAPLPEPLIRFFADRGAKVLNGYGLTETGPTVFLMDPEHAETKIGSAGRAQMLTDVRLSPNSAQSGHIGEIQMRGPNVTPGYFDDAEATACAFTPDGWLRTGDVGRFDEEGYLYVVDRIKDMFISGGENVYPAEVERILNTHPGVLEAAVVGVPDATWGEVGAAFLIPRSVSRPDPAEVRAWCRERLAAYKVPVVVSFLEDFPRTPAGKVRKPDLRRMLT